MDIKRIRSLIDRVQNELVGYMLGKEVQVEFLSASDVLALHKVVIERFGGSAGLRDQGLPKCAESPAV